MTRSDKTGLAIAVTVCLALALAFILTVVVARVRISNVQANAISRIRAADAPALLAACREMIEKRASYRNDFGKYPYLPPFWSINDIVIDGRHKKIDPSVPEAVLSLHPRYIVVETEPICVRVVVADGPVLAAVWAFPAGQDGQGEERLTNGLWLVTDCFAQQRKRESQQPIAP
jgi:hypothetical protein